MYIMDKRSKKLIDKFKEMIRLRTSAAKKYLSKRSNHGVKSHNPDSVRFAEATFIRRLILGEVKRSNSPDESALSATRGGTSC
jgi:hypothetical protein